MIATALATGSGDDCRKMPDLKCLVRVQAEIPVVKFGCEFFSRLITGLRESSVVAEWTLSKAIGGVDQLTKYQLPFMRDQLLAVDQLMCTSLDLTELNLPMLTKTPYEVYEESVDYLLSIVAPITEWVDVALLPVADNFVDSLLPELDPSQKTRYVTDERGSRACQLAVKLGRRVVQHAYAEPIYLGSLIYSGCEESILLMKTFMSDKKLLPKTFYKIWKKLGDGVTPEEAAKSLLLVEMGCIRLRKGAYLLVQTIEITEEMAKCYIEMFLNYVRERKNNVIDNFSRLIISTTEKQD